MNGFLKKYLRSELPLIAVCIVCFVIILSVLLLYRISAEPVLYSFAMSLFILLPYAFYRLIKTYKKYNELEILSKNSEIINSDSFVETLNITEQQYINLADKLIEDNRAMQSRFEKKYSDMADYYTLWAHQIKTPIAAMRLLLQSNENTVSRECEAELLKIEQYVDMVLGYLRLESETNDFVIKNYNVDNIVKTSAKKFSKLFILKKLSFNFKETGLTAVTDEKWLGFVIEQIISNALKYTKQGSISVFAENGFLCISDTGIGIAAEDLPRVCEKGYTGYNGRDDKKSTGLGLYLCKCITEKLGHGLYIESTLEKGTTVKINLNNNQFDIE